MSQVEIVFIVDDDVSVRQSLKSLVYSAGWEARVFASAQEFLATSPPSVPCCLVLDVKLPDIDGIELQGRVAAERPGMPVIFITGYGTVSLTVRAMKAGAVEFLTKPLDSGAILSAIAQALQTSAEVLRRARELRVIRACYASLSVREREVMALVVTGMLNKQVAGVLGISEVTVKAHRGQVMRKMKADSLPRLVNLAAILGLIPRRSSEAVLA